jgi:tetratricopeptide (TPR) repeat protein
MATRSEADFGKRSRDGYMAMLAKDYRGARDIFQRLMDDYPDEGASYIRYCGILLDERQLGEEHLPLLKKAETLVAGRRSQYPMDKFEGLRDLHFLRAFIYNCMPLLGADRSYYAKAREEVQECLRLDPEWGRGKKLKGLIEANEAQP